jgi:hypothetical protein
MHNRCTRILVSQTHDNIEVIFLNQFAEKGIDLKKIIK